MRLILILLTAVALNAKTNGDVDCSKLLIKAIFNLNKANSSKNIDRMNMYANMSRANMQMYSICIEVHDYYHIGGIKKELRKLR